MVSAVFGLVGVLVGGALNLWVGLRLDRRRNDKELRTAARLLLPELEEIRRILCVPSRPTRWGGLRDFPSERWATHERHLAESLSDQQWSDLETVYTSLRLFEDEAESYEPHDELFSDDVAHIELTVAVLLTAIESVERLAHGHRRSAVSEKEASALYEQSLREAELRMEPVNG
jgi:hypothetical protein